MELKNKQSKGEKFSDAETKEFGKLNRIRTLAGDFDRSHRYMLEKDSYSQQDIDYAFDLQKKEKDHAISPNMNEGRLFASDIYQSLFLEKVFGGLKQRFIEASQGDEPKTGWQLRNWLDEDMEKCVEQKKEEMIKITRGLVKDMKYPIEDTVISELWFLIKSRWIDRLFNTKGEEKQRELLQNAWKNMSYYGTLGKALNPIIRQVISEQPKEKDDESEADESVDDD